MLDVISLKFGLFTTVTPPGFEKDRRINAYATYFGEPRWAVHSTNPTSDRFEKSTKYTAFPGDYIVEFPNGILVVMPPAAFEYLKGGGHVPA